MRIKIEISILVAPRVFSSRVNYPLVNSLLVYASCVREDLDAGGGDLNTRP